MTAATLRATSNDYGRRRWTSPLGPVSDAAHWSRVLGVLTFTLITLAVAHTWLGRYIGQFAPPDDEGGPAWIYYLYSTLDILVPFFYGGIGACAFLLKSCHVFIYTRTFDINRKPEYINRIILGLLSGGMIVLFVSEVGTDDGDVVHLSAAALGFLAGYSTDFLFQTVERVITAILPKTGIESVQRAPVRRTAAALESVSLDALLDRYAQAPDVETRKLIESLITKLGGRL